MTIRQSIILGPLLFIIGSSFVSGKSRLHIPEPPMTQQVFFADSSHGWILQNSNNLTKKSLLRTSNGGKTWSSLGVHNDFLQIYFNDAQVGWAISVKSTEKPRAVLYATIDGGATWLRRSVITNPEGAPGVMILDFRFIDQQHGWFVGQGGGERIVVVTEDGGKSVKDVSDQLPGTGSLYGIFSLGQHIWIFGSNVILASPDAGQSWKNQIDNEQDPISHRNVYLDAGVIFKDGMGWAAGESTGPIIVATDNYGENWHIAFEAKEGRFTDIGFGDPLHGCAATLETRVFCTSDAGNSWHQVKIPLHEISNDPRRAFWTNRVWFSSPQRVWLIGHTGALFRSDNAGETWREVKLP